MEIGSITVWLVTLDGLDPAHCPLQNQRFHPTKAEAARDYILAGPPARLWKNTITTTTGDWQEIHWHDIHD